jgi:outer membrane protein OmpA-like peptidoglycan-associated protein
MLIERHIKGPDKAFHLKPAPTEGMHPAGGRVALPLQSPGKFVNKPCLAMFFAIALALHAQSHDSKSPTPLGPGINKGNVDNVTGSVYYSFHAGPGHVNMQFRFKSLGVFGNPLRQGLSFDLYENGKFLSHSIVVSTDKLEQAAPSGDLDSPRSFTLYVIPQSGPIRLGGYYEIEITGAVSYGAAKATGAGVKPEDTTLVKPGGQLTNGPVALTNGQVTLSSPGGALYEPGIKLYHPGQALTVQESSKETRLFLAADVLFDFDKASIRPDAARTLHQVAAIIRAKGKGVVRVEGYTDSKGLASYNARLSEQRAASVKEWLVSKEMFNAATLATQGFGSANPVVPNLKPDGRDDPDARQRNRRVEIVIENK